MDLDVNEMDAAECLRRANFDGFVDGRMVSWGDWHRAEGLAAGREEERRLLLSLAERKFGQAPVRRLATRLAGMNDADRLREVGDWIIDCDTSDDLIAHAAGEHVDLESFFEDRVVRWHNRLRAEGHAAAREEERRLLLRLAERKFGHAPVRRLATLLAATDDAGRLRDIGGWIIECETGDELITRVQEDDAHRLET